MEHFKSMTKKSKIIVAASLTIPFLALLFNIYSFYENRRINEINDLTNQLEAKKREVQIPLLEVNIFTLNEKEMSPEIIHNLSVLPSTIEVKHIRGETAKNVTLDFTCSVPIKILKQWKTTEKFSILFNDPNKKRFILNIPELRRDTKIGVTLLTFKPPEINFKFIADKGELFDLNKKIEILEAGMGVPYLSKSDYEYQKWYVSRVRIDLYAGIEKLDEKIKELKNKNLFKEAANLIFSEDPFIFPFLLLSLTLPIVPIGFSIFSYRRNRKKYKNTIEMIRNQKIKSGSSMLDIISLIGSPENLEVSGKRKSFVLDLYYPSYKNILPLGNLFLIFRFKDFKLDSIFNERNEEIINGDEKRNDSKILKESGSN